MIIIHYFLGFPPFRSGGLTKYAFDLMKAQADDGNRVIGLWPGRMKINHKKVSIKICSPIENIDNHEIINPLPVPLDEGIINIDAYIKECDKQVYIEYLKKVNPHVVHIHTLMGLHMEFLEACQELRIRTVFTSHDYFGLCPKVTLFYGNTICDTSFTCDKCPVCNKTALSMKKIMILQSPFYRFVKDFSLIKKMRKMHRTAYFKETHVQDNCDVSDRSLIDQYIKLRQYYINCYKKIDLIHFNSTVASEVFSKYFTPKKSIIMPITHKNIEIKHKYLRDIKQTQNEKSILKILYLAPAKPYKGYEILKKALDDLWINEFKNFRIITFGAIQDIPEYMINYPNGYRYDQLKEIFDAADILVAPSVWYETFGFTVLEALSNGVPVIVSDHVGAKDIINEDGIIVEAGNVESLKKAIKSLTLDQLNKLKMEAQNFNYQSWNDFLHMNYQLYLEK